MLKKSNTVAAHGEGNRENEHKKSRITEYT